MFCQAESTRKTHKVETLEKSADLIERAKADPVMSTRLSGVSDLIAAEGCYHLPCLITFERRSVKRKSSMEPREPDAHDECMMKLCRDLGSGLSRGHVYEIGHAWDRCESICNDVGTSVPTRYQSTKNYFL